MRRSLALAVLSSMLLPGVAEAVPPPMSDEEMMATADLVVDAACTAIACEGPPVDDGVKVITTYLSDLEPSHAYKGDLPASFTVRGEDWDYHGEPPVGGWRQGPIPQGWSGKLYLTLQGDGTYTKVWWNAMEEDADSRPEVLPDCDDGGDLCAGFYYQVCRGDEDCERPDWKCGPVVDGCLSSSCQCDPATGEAGACLRDCIRGAALCEQVGGEGEAGEGEAGEGEAGEGEAGEGEAGEGEAGEGEGEAGEGEGEAGEGEGEVGEGEADEGEGEGEAGEGEAGEGEAGEGEAGEGEAGEGEGEGEAGEGEGVDSGGASGGGAPENRNPRRDTGGCACAAVKAGGAASTPASLLAYAAARTARR